MRKLLLLSCIVLCLGVSAPPEGEVTEITLERTPCFGSCPVFAMTLHPGGTADYFGKMHVAKLGHYRGNFHPDDFARLSQLLEARGFFGLRPRYARAVTDMATVITRVKRGDTTTKVEDYGRAGPLDLWAIEMAITGVAADIDWKKVE
jgi:Domain of unknown function (DUF6438)